MVQERGNTKDQQGSLRAFAPRMGLTPLGQKQDGKDLKTELFTSGYPLTGRLFVRGPKDYGVEGVDILPEIL